MNYARKIVGKTDDELKSFDLQMTDV